jgi:hypothetical protein
MTETSHKHCSLCGRSSLRPEFHMDTCRRTVMSCYLTARQSMPIHYGDSFNQPSSSSQLTLSSNAKQGFEMAVHAGA